MSIVRVSKPPGKYFQMRKEPINDTRLSWKAKGIHAYLMSKPDDWQAWISDLVNRSTDGEHAVRTGLQELLEHGYAEREQERDEQGVFGPVRWTIHEEPLGGFPQAGKPDAENHHLTNNDSTNNEGTNIYSADADFPESSYKPGPGKLVSCEDPDTGEEVGEEDWRSPSTQLQAQAFCVCGRSQFYSKAERNKLERIEAMLETGELPEEFWKNRLWAAEQYQWSLPKLLKYSLDPDKLREWEARQHASV